MKTCSKLRSITSERYLRIALSDLAKNSAQTFGDSPLLGCDVSTCVLPSGETDGVRVYGHLRSAIGSNASSRRFADSKNKLVSYWVRSVQRLNKCIAIQYEVSFPHDLWDELISRNYPVCSLLRSAIVHAMNSFSGNLLGGDRLGYVVGFPCGERDPFARLIIHPLTDRGKVFSLSNRSRRQYGDTWLRIDFENAFRDCVEIEMSKISDLFRRNSEVVSLNVDEADMAIFYGVFFLSRKEGSPSDYINDFLCRVYQHESPAAVLREMQKAIANEKYDQERYDDFVKFVEYISSDTKRKITEGLLRIRELWDELVAIEIGDCYDKSGSLFVEGMEDSVSAYDRLRVTMIEAEKNQTLLSKKRRIMMTKMGEAIDQISMLDKRIAKLKLLYRAYDKMYKSIHSRGIPDMLFAIFAGKLDGASLDDMDESLQDNLAMRMNERICNRFLKTDSYVRRANPFERTDIGKDEVDSLLKSAVKKELSFTPSLSQRIAAIGPEALEMTMEEILEETFLGFE